ncbi:MAG: type IV toxin-antitoxin system AbiEi family antitoxin domain-containing protein [Acidobacteriota bacterium]|jgi:hypothetical protein
MKFEELLSKVGGEPIFETGFLLAGDDPARVRRQLSRWVRAGKIVQLRRGLYALAAPYRRTDPHPFLVSNRLFPGSYVSRESALAHYGLIPEYAPVVTAVGAGRPERLQTAFGAHELRHLQPRLIRGFSAEEVSPGQTVFIATAEKALLDLIYLTPGGDASRFLEGLRLQHLDRIQPEDLLKTASLFDTPKLRRAAGRIKGLAEQEREEYETL